eukprot:3767688-Karenia_brevis.AAC.1
MFQVFIIGGTKGIAGTNRPFLDIGLDTSSSLRGDDGSILLKMRYGSSVHDLIPLVNLFLASIRQR